MKQLMTQITILLAVVLAAGSCSVKEERAECPCWLKVFIEPFPHEGAVISAYTTVQVLSDKVSTDEYGGCYEASVPRSYLGVSCHNTPSSMTVKGSLVTIPKGGQSDSLYAHHAMVDCTGEEAVDRAKLGKQFATVYMTFEDPGDGSCPYDVRISGNVDGMDMASFKPHDGEFEYAPTEVQPLFYQYRVPRQKDSSLSLDLYSKEDGSYVDSLPLGEYIRESGFNWQAESLEDIVITVNFAKIEIEVKVSEWDADKVYEVTI